ncbi:MAG: SDR family NAD(P)-dependent oxidoreductase, partial [Vicinamibacteria bacterium]|nr:SDR family NAD(P)-dependent oxidoreductase [Vicinamibacteria bacterium]
MEDEMDLKGKNALVTGAAQGIGKAIALRLAEAGANVVVADINLDQAKQTAAEVQAKGVESMGQAIDVANEESVDQAIKAMVERFERIDILVNNAGITRD